MKRKEKVYKFFKNLETYLNQNIPRPDEIRFQIDRITKKAKESKDEPHLRYHEAAFLNYFATPHLYDFTSKQAGMNREKARQALLSESHKHLPHYTSGSPNRSKPHPFKKAIGVSARDVLKQWKNETPYSPVVQSCPDLALRPPFPYKVVIEGKYFSKGGIQAAETSLATDIYQAFFYLGLSTLPETKTHTAWDYEYACLLAYDATEKGSLLAAWKGIDKKGIDKKVKRGCWEGANIYVMLLRGLNS